MRKKLIKVISMALTAAMLMTACGNNTSSDNDKKTYAVEAGSAGEKAAKDKGYEYNSVASQADALMEVASGTSDAAIVDLLMSGAMIGEGTSYPNLKYTEKLTEEEYGIGCRKGSDLASYINSVLAKTYADGRLSDTAKKYGISENVIEQKECEYKASERIVMLNISKTKESLLLVLQNLHQWITRMKIITGLALMLIWQKSLLRN